MFSALPSTRKLVLTEEPSQWQFTRHWKVSLESLNICIKTNSSPISSPCPSLCLHHSVNSQLFHRTGSFLPPQTRIWSGVLKHSSTLCNHLKHSCSSSAVSPMWTALALPNVFRQVRGSHHQMEFHLCMLSLVHLLSSPKWNSLSYLIYISRFLCSFCICCLPVSKAALATFPTTDHNVVSSAVWEHSN